MNFIFQFSDAYRSINYFIEAVNFIFLILIEV